MSSGSHNISGQISRKLLEIADSFLLGAYGKVAKGWPPRWRHVTLWCHGHDDTTSKCFFFNSSCRN